MSNRIPLAYADIELQINVKISPGSETFTLASATDDDGIALPPGLYCFTVDNGRSNKEYLIGQLNGLEVTDVKSVSRQGVETTGAKNIHRVGASAIVTNFATLQRIADVMRGVLQLDADTPLYYDAEPTLSNREQIASVGYVLDIVTGGTVSFDNFVIAGSDAIAGEDIAAGEVIFLDESDQEWYLVDASDPATYISKNVGIAKGAGTNGTPIANGVHLEGTYTSSGLTAGALYYATDTPGGLSSTPGTNTVAIGLAISTTRLLVFRKDQSTISGSTVDALQGGADFGTPSGTNKFVTEELLRNPNGAPTVQIFDTPTTTGVDRGDATSRFDITDEGGDTFRYTWDGIGTDPGISNLTFVTGQHVMIAETGFDNNNEGLFQITDSNTNYFEVTNPNGVAEIDRTLGNYRTFQTIASIPLYTPPANVKYIEVEMVSAGGAGGYSSDGNTSRVSNGGGGGAYAKSILPSDELAATIPYFIGNDTGGGSNVSTDYTEKGGPSAFALDILLFGGRGGTANQSQTFALGGSAIRGQIKREGETGGQGISNSNGGITGGKGGNSWLGWGAPSVSSNNDDGINATSPGGGGSGAGDGSSSNRTGGAGMEGILIITEYYA